MFNSFSLKELTYLSENIEENNIQNLEPLSIWNPNDFSEAFDFKSQNNTSIKSIQEKVQENLIKYINLQILFDEEKIKNILRKIGINDKFNGNYITQKEKENFTLFKTKINFQIEGKNNTKKEKENTFLFNPKVKQTRNRNSNNNKEQNYLTEKKRGRKNKKDDTERPHGKKSSDNIIKKCKRIFFKYIIIFINSIIKTCSSNQKESFEFKNLSYENYINNLKKENEIKLLNMPLKDFVSLKISSKLGLNLDFNRQKMEKILSEEKNNQTLISLLSMTFGEWIDIFTFKKIVNYDFKFNGLEDVLIDLYKKEDDEYFSRFVFYLLNYKNWFRNIKPRKPKEIKN